MKLSRDDLIEIASSAQAAARSAGSLILRSTPERITHKAEGKSEAASIVTEVDRQSQALLIDALQSSVDRFSLALLSEELADDGARLRCDYFLSIDPLDGTLAYVENCPGFAVSIALVSREGVPQLGVVFDPTEDTLWCAIRGQGITRNGAPWTLPPPTPGAGLSVFADRSFSEMPAYPKLVEALDEISMKRGGVKAAITLGQGAVANACSVLRAPPSCYFKFPKSAAGGGALWDFAATACLFTAAGAIATDIEGRPLDLNRRDSTWMNHRGILFASDHHLAEQIGALYPGTSGDEEGSS